MTPEQIALIEQSLSRLNVPLNTVTERFYRRMFEILPESRALFPTDLRRQTQKFSDMVQLIVRSLPDWPGLTHTLRVQGERHFRYGARSQHYEAAGVALLAALEESSSWPWPPEVRAAWEQALADVCSTMLSATTVREELKFGSWVRRVRGNS